MKGEQNQFSVISMEYQRLISRKGEKKNLNSKSIKPHKKKLSETKKKRKKNSK